MSLAKSDSDSSLPLAESFPAGRAGGIGTLPGTRVLIFSLAFLDLSYTGFRSFGAV